MGLAADCPHPLCSACPSELLHSMTQGSRGWVCSSLIEGESVRWETAWQGGDRNQGSFPRFFRDVVLLTSGEQSVISQGPKDTENRLVPYTNTLREVGGQSRGRTQTQSKGNNCKGACQMHLLVLEGFLERQKQMGLPLGTQILTAAFLKSSLYYRDLGADKCPFGVLPLTY